MSAFCIFKDFSVRYMTYHNGQDIFDILKAPVEQLKGKKVQLYAVSVGSLVKDKTLQFITTGPGYIFKSDQASNLIEGIKKGSETDCQKIGMYYSCFVALGLQFAVQKGGSALLLSQQSSLNLLKS